MAVNYTVQAEVVDIKYDRPQPDDIFLETMTKEGIVNLITDDGDFVTVPGIKVFTSNRHAITAATNQGKLLVR